MNVEAFLRALPLPEPPGEPGRCPACRLPQGRAEADGEAGCPVCYDAFAASLARLVR